MACTFIRDNSGRGMIVCGPRRPRKFCKDCGREFASKLCDFPVGPKGKTCDTPICDKCATPVGPDRYYCPKHKGMKPGAEQGCLFTEAS